MKNKIWLWIIVSIIIIGLVVGGVYLSVQVNDAQAAKNITPTPAEISLSLDLSFDQVEDQNWFDLLPGGSDDPAITSSTNFIRDNALVFEPATGLGGVNAKMQLEPGSFFHIRMKANTDKICVNTGIFTPVEGGEKRLSLGACPYDVFSVQAILNSPTTPRFDPIQGNGLVLLEPGQWIDLIFWQNNTGDKIYYFAANPQDSNKFLYGGIELPKDWQTDFWVVYFGAGSDLENQSMSVDFLRYGYGQVIDYLYYQSPAYLTHKVEVDDYFQSATLPLITFDEEQVSLPDEVDETTEPTDSQAVVPAETQSEYSTLAQLFKQFTDKRPVINGRYQFGNIGTSGGTLFNQYGFSLPLINTEAQFNGQFGEVNFFYFENPDLTQQERLDEFERSQFESWIPDAPMIGDASRMAHAGGEPPHFHGIIVKNNWVVLYYFDKRTQTDPPSALIETPQQVQAFFDELFKLLPAELLDPSLLQPMPEFVTTMAQFQGTPGFLPADLLISAASVEDTWSTAEKAGCLLLSQNGADQGKICLFRDFRPDLDAAHRVSLMDDLTSFHSRGVDQTGLQLGDFAKFKTTRVNGNQLVYFGQFVSGEWSGYFELPELPEQDMLVFIPALVQPILAQLPQVAASQDQTFVLEDSDQQLFAMADLLPESYYLGKLIRYTKYNALVHEIELMGQGDFLKKGSIKLWHYSGRMLDQSRTDFDLPDFTPKTKPIITGVDTIADRSVMFKWDEDSAGQLTVQRFQKSDTFVDVALFSDIPEAQTIVQTIAQTLADQIGAPSLEPFALVGNENELQYLQCFPAQGDLGFDKPMAQYTINTSLTHKGFIYSTRYTDFTLVDHYAPVGTLGVSIQVFNVPMAGLDIPDYENDEKDIITGLADYAQLSQVVNTNNFPNTYESTLAFVKGQSLVTLTLVELESNPITRERLINVARSMASCLPQHALASAVISVPSDINKTPLQEGYITLEGYGQGDEQNSSKLELFGILHLYIAEPIAAPLTIALFDPRTQLIYYKKQEKSIPPPGEYEVILRPEDQLVIPSIGCQLYIWSGDQLFLHTFPMVEQGGGF